MEDGTNYWALFAMIFPFGLFLFTAGFCVYRQTTFMYAIGIDAISTGKPSLAITYLGAWLMLMSLSHFVLETENDLLSVPYGLVMFGCQAIGIIGWLWMPKFLQPAWMKESDRLMARGEDRFIREFLNGEGPSKGESQSDAGEGVSAAVDKAGDAPKDIGDNIAGCWNSIFGK